MVYSIKKDTKTYKLFTAMKSGEKVTASQAEKRFGIKNISAEVSRIKSSGYAVYTRNRKAGNGVNVREYQMGVPSRKFIALAYKAQAMGFTV